MDRYAGEGIPGFVGRAGLGRTRSGHRVWPADVKGRISDGAARKTPEARIEISVGKVVLRVQSDTSSLRLAEIVAALERQP